MVPMQNHSFLFKMFRFAAQSLFYVLEWILEIVDDLATSLMVIIWPTEYIRISGCQGTGQCCQAIGLGFPKWWERFPRILDWIKRWHYLRYNFVCYGIHEGMIVYHCLYLTSDKKCGIQNFKPKVCRDFPKTPLIGFTKLHKGCGYSFIKRDGSDLFEIVNAPDEVHVVPKPKIDQQFPV